MNVLLFASFNNSSSNGLSFNRVDEVSWGHNQALVTI